VTGCAGTCPSAWTDVEGTRLGWGGQWLAKNEEASVVLPGEVAWLVALVVVGRVGVGVEVVFKTARPVAIVTVAIDW